MTKPVKLLGWIFRWKRLLLAGALLIVYITPSLALAQSTDDDWTEPINLSHSGVATKPAIVSDSEGVVHVVWQDDLANFVYTRFDGNQWSTPVTTDLGRLFTVPIAGEPAARGQLPMIYTGPNPLFIAGPGRDTFAFWISPEGRLFTSSVRNPNFEHVTAWESAGVISHQAASFAVAIDARGEWHLAYFRTVSDPLTPAGVYYTHSRNGGKSWAIPVLLYESPYLRRLAAGEANISLTTAGTEDALNVYIAWDNRPRKQVFLAQSTDGGKNWEQPVPVAGPAPDSGFADPFNIQVGAIQNSVVLVWQSGLATNGLLPGCKQIYKASSDAGTTWSDLQPINEDMQGCAKSNEFLPRLSKSDKDSLYFLAETESQVFLTAWNGHQWSQQQEQPILAGFKEPELYTEVIYGCHQASWLGERLYIVGCDQGDGGDVWVTSRDLVSDISWFQPQTWSQLSPVTGESLKMEALELVSTDDGFIHAFLSQQHDPTIYYTYWDGELWSRMNPVLELPEGEAAWPAIAVGPKNELFLIARNNRGMLYFSRAISGSASTQSRWSTPTRLEIGHDGEISSFDVAWDATGTVYIAYCVPINEERGIYLVQSKDQGTTWSEPLQVFDGAAAGLDLVGAPSLLTSKNGFLHIIWTQQSIQGDGVPQTLSLYYTRSEDGGRTFNDAEPVVKEPVAWRKIMTDGKGNLHLLWQAHDNLTTVWDQVSSNGGRTWQYPEGLPDEGKLAAVTTDAAGRVHLVGVGPKAFRHWFWDGSHWQSETPPSWHLSSQQESPVELLAAIVNKQGKMMVVLAEQTGEGDVVKSALLYSTRTLELPPILTAIQKVPTQTLLPPTFTPAAPTPERLLTPTSPVHNPTTSPGQIGGNATNDRTFPIAMTLLPVVLLLLGVLGFVIRQAARAKDR